MEMKQTGGQGFKPLQAYGRNLNLDVKNNKIDPIIGREEEIRRIVEILSRKSKNNPVLIGEPGVGKTAIVEGLAQRIVHRDVPDNLLDKEIWELSLSSLISGASFQGQFEERLQQIINEVKKSNGNTILFIDEIHQLVGMGKNQGAMDAANILKPMMARGEIKIIGATTLKEYREYIEKDAALERRMTKVLVSEPTKQEALTIMRGLKEKWEVYHGVKISDSALVAAVDLSQRYITDRFLPDKAIDLIDEACAKVQTEMHSMPEELDQIKREIVHLKTEQAALQKENSPRSADRLEEIKKLLEDLSKKDDELSALWKKEKADNEAITTFKTKIESARRDVEKFQSTGEYSKASELLYVTIPNLEKQKEAAEQKLKENPESHKLLRDRVTEQEIGEVISKATGIPLNKIVASEQEKLLHLKEELAQRVKGQDEALEVVSDAVLRGRAGINNPNRPIGSFLFLGPTGVGKTEVAKSLAATLFDSEKAMIRFDMSEFMEKHSVSKLIGAPPGYVGYEQAGGLTEAVRRHPYSVILFDEIEKANSDVLNIMLQILDEGQIKDGQGRTVNFKNTIIIMTSNIGAEQILEGKKEKALDDLKLYLKPELVNRIDEIILFNPLGDKVIVEIVKKLLNDLRLRLFDEGYDVEFKVSLAEIVKDRGYDYQYGARPLSRWIQKHIENKLAEDIIANKVVKNKRYVVDFDKDRNVAMINEQ